MIYETFFKNVQITGEAVVGEFVNITGEIWKKDFFIIFPIPIPKDKPLQGAIVKLIVNGVEKKRTQSGFDGKFTLSFPAGDLNEGYHYVKLQYDGDTWNKPTLTQEIVLRILGLEEVPPSQPAPPGYEPPTTPTYPPSGIVGWLEQNRVFIGTGIGVLGLALLVNSLRKR